MKLQIYREPRGTFRWRLLNNDNKTIGHGVSTSTLTATQATVREILTEMPKATAETKL